MDPIRLEGPGEWTVWINRANGWVGGLRSGADPDLRSSDDTDITNPMITCINTDLDHSATERDPTRWAQSPPGGGPSYLGIVRAYVDVTVTSPSASPSRFDHEKTVAEHWARMGT